MHQKTLAELSKGLQSGETSSVALTQHYLERIQGSQPILNSFITVTAEKALADAELADKRLAEGNAHPLTGIPIAHKDIFCTEGIATTCASKMLENFTAPYQATMVQRCQDAGMVLLGKTNMDEFAMGSSNENSYFGSVKNPWDLSRVPGGSSGGSAAAVAAQLTPIATGTDTGGSIRQPSSLCGITGIKPTYGRISRYGQIAFASSLDQAGPMAKTAEDCAMMLNVMAGFDLKDSTSVDQPVPDYCQHLNRPIKGLKIGIPKAFFSKELNADIANAIRTAIDELAKLGAECIDIDLPNNRMALSAYYVLGPAEASSNLSRYDGVRFGHRCENPVDLEDLYKRSRGEGFGCEVKRRILTGTFALSSGYYDAYYLKAQKLRRLVYQDFMNAFEQVDVIVGPTSPCTAFKLGEKAKDPVTMYLTDIYTLAVNLAGLPGMSVPAGFCQNLPVGMQLIGKPFDESTLFNVAHQYQQATHWHKLTPEWEQA